MSLAKLEREAKKHLLMAREDVLNKSFQVMHALIYLILDGTEIMFHSERTERLVRVRAGPLQPHHS